MSGEEEAQIKGPRLPPDVIPPQPPRLRERLPNTNGVHEIESALDEIYQQGRVFISSVALAEISAANDLPRAGDPALMWRDWRWIAARSAVLAARNFGEALKSAGSEINRFDREHVIADRAQLKRAGKIFREMFPMAVAARDIVAHPETFIRNRERASSSKSLPGIFEISGSTISVRESWINGVFTSTMDGVYVECPMHRLAVEAVLETIRVYFAAFDMA